MHSLISSCYQLRGVVFFCRCCHCRTYSAANSCSNLDSSGAMMKNLSNAFPFWVIPTIPTIPPITFSVNWLWPVGIWLWKRVKVFWCLSISSLRHVNIYAFYCISRSFYFRVKHAEREWHHTINCVCSFRIQKLQEIWHSAFILQYSMRPATIFGKNRFLVY